MAAPGADQPIANWTVTLLTKFLEDWFQRNPIPPLPLLTVDELVVRSKLTVSDRFSFANSDWRIIGNTGQPAFENAWETYGAPYAKAAFTRDADGWVHLTGVIKNGTVGSAAFTLPPGYRPATDLAPIAVVSNGAFGRVDIGADGTVIPISPSTNASVALDNIVFKAA